MGSKKPPEQMEQIEQSTFKRTWSMARLTLNAGAKVAGHAIGNWFRDENSRAEAGMRLLQDQLTELSTALGQLKGSAMKVGQMLSMYGEYFLPPQANILLKSLQNQSPPLAWPRIWEVLQQELTAEQLAIIDIESKHYAAASLGQVHRARRKSDGKQLAIKIQYPGVEEAIASDLRAISGMLMISKLLPRKLDQKGFFAEVKMMLEQEADYRIELMFTEKFRTWLSADPRFVIPTPEPTLCSRHVLCTSFEEGLSPDSPEVLNLPQARRDQLAYNILDLYMFEVWHCRHVQTDPHFGNYRIRLAQPPDRPLDQIVLLDFGAVREVPESMLLGYREMVLGTLLDDRQKVLQGGKSLGFLAGNENETTCNLFYEICELICEPFLDIDRVAPEARHLFLSDGSYNWGASDLPLRLARKGAVAAFNIRVQAPPREAIFLDRKLSGVFIFLSKLKAFLRGRPILEKYLPELAQAAHK